MKNFDLVTSFKPRGDQLSAINNLVIGLNKGFKSQVLLGVTGSGKTFVMANVIKEFNKPTLVLAHNKTLASQLYAELKGLFPNNAVKYFVSYYDYYQPEAYVPQTDLYIEKDASINENIERMRNEATQALMTRSDVIIVASVSCIYGIGSPSEYSNAVINLKKGDLVSRDHLIARLVNLYYTRNNVSLERGQFRVRGSQLEVYPPYGNEAFRIMLDDESINSLSSYNPLTMKKLADYSDLSVFPAKQYVIPKDQLDRAISDIEFELADRASELEGEGRLLEKQRLLQRTNYDIEMIRETGSCNGVENYSRHLEGRKPGEPPYSLIDYFPRDFLLIIDESHVSVPQVRGMYFGDLSRKQTLVDYGWRLPSAKDNRPLKFDEFNKKLNQTIYVSATPSSYELGLSEQTVELIVRPTGLVDPRITVLPISGQMEDLLKRIKAKALLSERVLITTLTKRMAEDLTEYLLEKGVKAKYMHSDIDVLERVKLLLGLRRGDFDVLVGINLLREGLDLPEVSLVAILDADKEGFLRNETSLIQTIGRASRNVNGEVVMYADNITDSMNRAINETNRRREKQEAYNKERGITPETIKKEVKAMIQVNDDEIKIKLDKSKPVSQLMAELEDEMLLAANNWDFERAAILRDELLRLKKARGDDIEPKSNNKPAKKRVSRVKLKKVDGDE